MLIRMLSCLLVLALGSALLAETACGGCYPIHAVNIQVTGSTCLTAKPGGESGTCPSVAVDKEVTVLVDNQCTQDFVITAVGDSGVAPAPVKAGETDPVDQTMGSVIAERANVSGTIGGAPVTVSWAEETYTK